ASDRVSRLQKGATLAACLGRPKLGHDRRPGRPFRADREPNKKAKYGKRHPIPGERAHAREQRIGKDRERHRPLAAAIVGKHAGEQAADRPTEYGYRNDRAGIGGDERVLGRLQELMQRDAHGENKREHFETIERPPEVRGDKRFPLRAVERAIPWRRLQSADFAHDPLPDCSACPAGSSRMKAYANIPRAWKSGLCRQSRRQAVSFLPFALCPGIYSFGSTCSPNSSTVRTGSEARLTVSISRCAPAALAASACARQSCGLPQIDSRRDR